MSIYLTNLMEGMKGIASRIEKFAEVIADGKGVHDGGGEAHKTLRPVSPNDLPPNYDGPHYFRITRQRPRTKLIINPAAKV